ncbi:hypothetical protein A2482_02690 [Candidatus Falkowbacteria bacterium RIFOXYC2_FULL_48_21]|uniref:HD/PDEase domain-containing protein n=1 Tax=Candidatus Falkowbacteria bacterium RIFOXYC2_FULL_48_21 TaxID=1798005 RepID=A0A1F5TBK4_9BACT|nr:MAG: hypothetical protein A2482_02690 [Candidatus Falkowbacteria bacterium RIFOXYC2_FULL_48_21]
MTKSLNIKFEKAVRLLVEYFPVSDETSRKPVLFHDIRVGVYLYEHGYAEDVVLAGVLHDAIEWSNATQEMLQSEFGDNVLRLIMASTKDDSITDKDKKTTELIKRCISNGEEALIVKTADILDSFKWYSSQNSEDQLRYCLRNANAILKYKPDDFKDNIFRELQAWQEKYSSLTE